MKSGTLVIGIGNRYRDDDAAGCVLADTLKELALPDVEVITHSGEPASLIDLWQSRENVFLIDAVSSNAKPGTLHHIDLKEQALPDNFRSYSTHAFGIAEAVELARALNKLPPRIVFYGIEGRSFAMTQSLSPDMLKAMDEIKTKIVRNIKEVSHA